MTTIQQALLAARQRLSHAHDSAALEAEILLGHALQQSRTQLYTWPHKAVSTEQQQSFEALVARRLQGEPMAYILGYREFWDLNLAVSPATLIPRAETERLVEIALQLIPSDAHWRVADLGTGSGAIALAIAKHRPNCQVIASDVSKQALAVAQHNATQLQIANIQFKQGVWCQPLRGSVFDLVVSNPPYVADNDPHLQQGDLRFEPATALASGHEGLNDISAIARSVPAILKKGGWLLLEHGYNQGNVVKDLLTVNGFQQIICYYDYGERERATIGQIPH